MQGCNSMDLSRPFNPTVSKIDSSPEVKKTSLPLKNFKTRAWNEPASTKKNSKPFSLSPPHLFSFSQNSSLSLSLFLSSIPEACKPAKSFPPRRCRRDRVLTSSETPKPDGSFFSCSLTLSLTSPAHSIVTPLISPLSSHRYFGAHLRMPAPLCPYLRCTARFQSPSQPPAASVTTSLKEFTDKVF